MDEQPIGTLNVIPFVDIMLLLLTIVLTTASFITTGRIPITLPDSSQTQVQKREETKTIEIVANGTIHFEGTPVSKDEFQNRLKALPPDTSFLIRADRDLAFQGFIDVADILKRLNFTKVAVQTQIIPRSR